MEKNSKHENYWVPCVYLKVARFYPYPVRLHGHRVIKEKLCAMSGKTNNGPYGELINGIRVRTDTVEGRQY